jgi:hypothetical protein
MEDLNLKVDLEEDQEVVLQEDLQEVDLKVAKKS